MTIRDRQEYSLTIDGNALALLDQGTVTLDDSWAPYVQAKLTVLTPVDATILDSRDLPQVTLKLLQQFGDGLQFTSDLTTMFAGGTSASVTALWGGWATSAVTNLIGAWNSTRIAATSLEANLYITAVTHHPDGTTDLSLASGEVTLQGVRQTLRIAATNGSIAEFFKVTIRDIFPYLSSETLVAGDADAIIPADSLAGIFGVPPASWNSDHWSLLQGFATMADLRLWCHPDGIFRLTPRWESVPGTIALDSIIDAPETINREDDSWADGVIVEYLEDPTTPERPTVSDAGTTTATKVAVVNINVVTPLGGEYVDPAPAAILARMLERGRSIEVTNVNRFNTAPNMAVTIDEPALGWLPASTGVVDAVTFDLETKQMRVTVRELQEA